MEPIQLYGAIFTEDYLLARLMPGGECYVAVKDNNNGFKNSVRLSNKDRIKLIKALGGNV